ncbi:hypothetical protein Hdeb2414_s0018g00531951 [Helianthus debilis subsp. tardiflorus]
MVLVRHFEFVCRSVRIEPTVNRFRVFHQMHCSQGFYSFVQRASAKKILLQPPKSFHDWKPKFFFIKAGMIPMKMSFRGKEDVANETIQTPFSENGYHDVKDVPSIELPEKALVAAGMSLFWRMEREEKPVYMEDGKKGGSMATIPKKADEKLWYLRIVKNFALPRDEDLSSQFPTGAVVKKPKAEPRDAADIPASNADDPIDLESSPEPLLKTKAGKRKQAEVDAEAQPTKKVQKRKITRRGNLDAFIAKPPPEKLVSPVHAEPSSTVNEDLPPSPPRAPISERLESTKAAGEDVAEKTAEAGNPEVEKSVEVVVEMKKVVDPETAGIDSAQPKSPKVVARYAEKGKSAQEDPVTIFPTSASAPVNVERSPTGDQGSFSYDAENSPIRPDETLGDYYYRTYSEKKAAEIHTPVWNLKKGGTFSYWRVCRDWLQGTFPPGEIQFQEGHLHEQNYHAYLEEAATYTSTTHRIVREWRSMHKEWAAFEASKKKAAEYEAQAAFLRAKLEVDGPSLKASKKLKNGPLLAGKEKQRLRLLSFLRSAKIGDRFVKKDNNEKIGNLKAEVERLKKQDADIEKLKQEKTEAEAARDEARSHRERSEQREVWTCATLALRDKEIDELTAYLSEQEKLRRSLSLPRKIYSLNELKELRLPATSMKLKKSWRVLKLPG